MRASVRPPHLAQLGQIGAERKGRQVGPVGRAAPGHRQAHPPRPARSGRRMRSASPARHRPWPPARPGQRSPGRRQGRKCRSWPAAVPGDGSRSSAASPTRGSRVAGGAHSPLPAAGGLDQPRPPVASQWQAVAAGAPQWQPAAIDVPCTKCPLGHHGVTPVLQDQSGVAGRQHLPQAIRRAPKHLPVQQVRVGGRYRGAEDRRIERGQRHRHRHRHRPASAHCIPAALAMPALLANLLTC